MILNTQNVNSRLTFDPSICYRLTLIALMLLSTLSFWICSRFTVDDAFITWRYGRNLVQFGIWGYNPALFDITQAYTNPIYAFLSIIPAYVGMDMVLFFKLSSCLLGILFCFWFVRVTKTAALMLGALMCLPATMIHLFSGLETFLFVFLFSILLLALDEKKHKTAILATLLLFVTRPESWLFIALVPSYLACRVSHAEPVLGKFEIVLLQISKYELIIDYKLLALSLITLGPPLGVYFAFHYYQFGSWLPNTFHIKANAVFSLKELTKFIFFMTPLVLLYKLNRRKMLLFCLAIFGAMSWSYSNSYLFMDYEARFAFHIFIPIYVYLVYLAASLKDRPVHSILPNRWPFKLDSSTLIKTILLAYLAVFGLKSGIRAISLFNAYPRALEAHAALGKAIKSTSSSDSQILAIGDAGMAAYHADILVLDTVGLASGLVGKHGLNDAVLDAYSPSMIAFYSTPTEIDMNLFGQRLIYEWAIKHKLSYQCDLYWRSDYTFKIYTKKSISTLSDVCRNSQVLNDKPEQLKFSENVLKAPWSFWKE